MCVYMYVYMYIYSASKPHKQKILPVRDGLRTSDLRIASSTLFQLSYAVRSNHNINFQSSSDLSA